MPRRVDGAIAEGVDDSAVDAMQEFLVEKDLPLLGGALGRASAEASAHGGAVVEQPDFDIIRQFDGVQNEFLPERELLRRMRIRRAVGNALASVALAAAATALLGLFVLGRPSNAGPEPDAASSPASTSAPAIAGVPEPVSPRFDIAAADPTPKLEGAEALSSDVAAEFTVRPAQRTETEAAPLQRQSGGDAASNAGVTASIAPAPLLPVEDVLAARIEQHDGARPESRVVEAGSVVPRPDPAASTLLASTLHAGNDGAAVAAAVSAVPALPRPMPPAVAAADETSADDRGPVGVRSDASAAAVPAVPWRDLLAGYRTAYERLDARLAKQVWPAVDEASLARAFDALESQTVTFDACDVSLATDRSVASCRGSATYVTGMGHRTSHTERRHWTFVLERSAQRWVIATVEIR